MIDELVATLAKEQKEDDDKKEYCTLQLDENEDKMKGLKRKLDDLEVAIADEEETLSTVKSEIKALEKGIKELDKQVAEASEIRKKEHEDFSELMASDNAAKEILEFAKNRLQKFYNPKLYKPPPTEASFLHARARAGERDAPPPPPETFGAYAKKSEESGGVIAMMDLLVKELDKEMTEEEDAQKGYEEMISDSAAKRAEDSKAIGEKKSAQAATETQLAEDTEAKKGTGAEYVAAGDYQVQLHKECDWLLKNFDLRKEARAGEVDALKKAKAVLSGADFSLAQVRAVLSPR